MKQLMSRAEGDCCSIRSMVSLCVVFVAVLKLRETSMQSMFTFEPELPLCCYLKSALNYISMKLTKITVIVFAGNVVVSRINSLLSNVFSAKIRTFHKTFERLSKAKKFHVFTESQVCMFACVNESNIT